MVGKKYLGSSVSINSKLKMDCFSAKTTMLYKSAMTLTRGMCELGPSYVWRKHNPTNKDY